MSAPVFPVVVDTGGCSFRKGDAHTVKTASFISSDGALKLYMGL